MACSDKQGAPGPQTVPWQWDEAAPRGQAEADGNRFVFAADETGGTAHIRRIGPDGTLAWGHSVAVTVENEAAFVLHGGRLYAALYARGATGCRVLALEAATGKPMWERRLQGLGSIFHSKYSNRVQMRLESEWLVIFGKESGGRYIEMLDPNDSRLLFNRVIPW